MAETQLSVLGTLRNDLTLSLDNQTDLLPGDFNKARFVQNTISAVKANPNLLKCRSNDILRCSLQAAYLGLDFMNKEAWIVPYSGEPQFQIGYKGACKFIKKYSIRPIQDIYAKIVRKGDEFEYGDTEGKQYVNWKPVPFNNDEMVGVYACIQFKDGGVLYEVMSKEEVDKIRRRSKSSSNGPWVTDYNEMAKKTVLKRIAKNVETDFDNTEQRAAWDLDDTQTNIVRPVVNDEVGNVFDDDDPDAINVDAVDVPTDVPDVEGFK